MVFSELERKNVAIFSCLFISCLFIYYISQAKKGDWNTFLVRKTKFFLPLYQDMGISDQQDESQVLLDAFLKKTLPGQMNVET